MFGGQRKMALALVTLGIFLLVLSPWIVRNISASGLPFGVTTYTALEETPEFSEYNCFACHHDLEGTSWRQQRGYDGRPAGSG